MDPERYQRLRALFHEGATIAAEQRAAWLDRVCAQDVDLRAELERLLRAQGVLTGEISPRDTRPTASGAGARDELHAGARVGPYEVVRRLGRGGMGTVYLAQRAGSSEPLALKVFHPHLSGASDIAERFAREAEMGRRVAHENVVRTLDSGQAPGAHGTHHYLVMEYVEGRTLRDVLNEYGTVPEGMLREIARQVAAGLTAIHAQGIVHRDLKPENILIARDQRVRIMDLGVAKALFAAHTLTLPGHFVGSLAYAAPEQTDGTRVGPPADLYALGTVLFELASASLPIKGATFAELLQARVGRPAPVLREQAPGVSTYLSEVVAVLLARDPGQRFQTAEELQHVLTLQEDSAWWRSRRAALGRARAEVAVDRATSIQARESEVTALVGCWRRARTGQGHAVLLEGEAGLGKSRLLDAFLQHHEVQDADVIYASYARRGPQQGVRGALRQRLGSHGLKERLEALLGEMGEQAAPLAQVLRAEPAQALVPPLSPAQTESALQALCAGLAAERPLIFLIDDLHLAPADLVRDVLAVANACLERPLLCVIATRPEGMTPQLRALASLSGTHRIALTRLPLKGVIGIAREVLRDDLEARNMGPELHRRSDGIPYHVLELLRALSQREQGHPPGVLGALPPALADLVGARLDGLLEPERAVLEAAAVQGYSFDVDLIAAVRGLNRLQVLEVLAHLERRTGLVRAQGIEARFDHHLVQEVLYERMMPALRAELHALTAEALSKAPARAQGDQAWQIVRQHLSGSRPNAALPYLAAALDHLETIQDFGGAVSTALTALKLCNEAPDDTRLELLLRLSRRLASLPGVEPAKNICREALELAQALGRTSAARSAAVRLSRAHLMAAEYAEADAEARKAAEEARAAGETTVVGECLSIQGQVAWSQGRYTDARALQQQVLELARETGDERMEGRALSNLGVVEQELGLHEEAERHLRQARDTLERAGDRHSLVPATTNLGNVLHDRGHRAEALALYESSLGLDTALGSREGLAIGWINVAEARMHMGDFAGAHAAVERSLVISRTLGTRRVEGYGLQGRGQLLTLEGRRGEALAALQEALKLRRQLGEGQAVANTLLWLSQLTIEGDAPEQAAPYLNEIEATARRVGLMCELAWCLALRSRLDVAGAQAAREVLKQHVARFRHDAHFEIEYQLWKATGDDAHRAAARRLLDHLRRHSPPEWREPMVELIPHFREVVGVGGDGPPGAQGATPPAPG